MLVCIAKLMTGFYMMETVVLTPFMSLIFSGGVERNYWHEMS